MQRVFFQVLFILITRGQSQQPQTLALHRAPFKTAKKKKNSKKKMNKRYKIHP